MENEKKDDVVVPAVEVDPIAERDLKIAKLEEERDNYKNVALKRLGKLPNDAAFAAGEDGAELSVAEQVRIALLDKEIDTERKAKEDIYQKTLKENAELKLALKNRPESSIGSDSGANTSVKDNVFSEAQLEALRKRALALKADPEKFIENAKKNLLAHR